MAELCFAQAPVGEVDASMATVKGSVVASPTGTQVMSGSSITASVSNTSVRLIRGGEIRVCQGSSVSLTSSPNRSGLLLGLSDGTIEAHYSIDTSLDTIWTPDFRIALAGPGLFHLAVNTDARGNTCVQTLHGHTGSVTVVELLGGEVYAVKPGERVIFRNGRVSQRSTMLGDCGCPPSVPVHSASTEPSKLPEEQPAAPTPAVTAFMAPAPEVRNVTAPLPVDRPGDVHIEVEAPFVFRASAPPPPPDAPTSDDVRVRLSDLPAFSVAEVQPPPDKVSQPVPVSTQVAEDKPKKKKRHGFWGAIAAMFGG